LPLLTELKIRSLKACGKPYKIFDEHGLYLEVYPSGSKIWRLKYKLEGKETRKSLFSWPEVSLKHAREAAGKFRMALRNGEIKRTKKELTVDALFQEWKVKFYPNLSPATIKKYELLFNKHISTAIGSCFLSDISPSLLLEKLFRPIEKSGHYETLQKNKSILSALLRYAVATGQINHDYTQDLRGAFPSPTVRHRAAILEKTQIGRLMADIFQYKGQPSTVYCLRILPYVFTRPGELRNAEWEEFDFEDNLWRIPSGRMKMRAAHLVPLAR
jgi:integrase